MVLFLTRFASFSLSILIAISTRLNFVSNTLMKLSSSCLPCPCWTFKHKSRSSREFDENSSTTTNSSSNLLEENLLSTCLIKDVQKIKCDLGQCFDSNTQLKTLQKVANANECKIEFECKNVQEIISPIQINEDEIKKLKNIVKIESKALASLYYDLEAERSASAMAAKETMAMITRLQEEKAIIQLEAQQYKRMAEERTFHDKKIIDKLKEIIANCKKDHDDLQNFYNCRIPLYGNDLNFTAFHINTNNNEHTKDLLNYLKKLSPNNQDLILDFILSNRLQKFHCNYNNNIEEIVNVKNNKAKIVTLHDNLIKGETSNFNELVDF
jgi:hypothetical protein